MTGIASLDVVEPQGGADHEWGIQVQCFGQNADTNSVALDAVVSDPVASPPFALDNLPSMPAAAATIVSRCDDPNVGIAELSATIMLDPALSARILRIANSAAYRRGDEITTLDRATMLMGLKVVKLTALGFVVSSTLSDSLESTPDLESQVWQQCLVEAVACRELALLAGLRWTAEAFLVGLFDGMGQLLALMTRPAEYGQLLAKSPWPNEADIRAVLGTSLGDLVARALDSWEVPTLYSRILAAAELDRNPKDHSEVAQLSSVLTLARHASRLLLGQRGRQPERAALSVKALGLRADVVDTLAVRLGRHVTDLADTLDVDLGATPDYAMLLAQARGQMIQTAMEIAQESVERAGHIETLEAEHDSLRHDALTDRLTGLPNRARFDDTFRAVFEDRSSGRTESGFLGIAMIDIDHFKAFNDTYGHQCGDLVLAAVGKCLAAITRRGETIARYGGEEFVLIMPVVDSAAALHMVAERIRQAIASLEIDANGQMMTVTVSVGAAATADVAALTDGAAIVEAADQMLYEAKRAGRNTTRVMVDDGSHDRGSISFRPLRT